MQDITWGIIGCGWIANMFASSLKALETGTLVAGASRTPGRAQEFAEKHGLDKAYSDYESLVQNPDIDIIYVATTHNFHYEGVKLCLENGKNVLCEKPFMMNMKQATELVDLARSKKLFLMEALWTRFLPSMLKLQELLAEGAIGEVQTVYANFSVGPNFEPEHRMRNKALAGGAVLDLGIYPISMADIVFGEAPERILSFVSMDPVTDVDELSHYFFEYKSGQKAILTSGYSQNAPIEARVCGSKGYIQIPMFLGAKELQIYKMGEKTPEILEFPYGDGENFKYEIAHAMECLADGKTESDVMPLSKTLETTQTMDTLRAQWGLTYPGE
jgi:predicted dehydrogenase